MMISSSNWILSLLLLIYIVITIGSASSSLSNDRPSSSFIKFLHITDFHFDPYYKKKSDPEQLCHRDVPHSKSNQAGYYGTVASNCDSPKVLIKETFQFLNIFAKDVKFILWTGDSARHDRDKLLPRDAAEAYSSNAHIVNLFTKSLNLSSNIVIPAVGNWDTWPANEIGPGPNSILDKLWEVWTPLFASAPPEEYDSIKSTFLKGGYFARQVLDGLINAISINTLYWFAENTLVSDCSEGSLPDLFDSEKPGDKQLVWLSNLLNETRSRGMFAIIAGHVPPISTEQNTYYKSNCLRHFTRVLGDFGDVILGSYFGHINTDSVVFVVAKRPYDSKPDTYHLIPATPANVKKNLDLKTDYLISVLYTSTSVVPVSLPSFRLGNISIGTLPPLAVPATMPRVYMSDYSQYSADIVRANRLHKTKSKPLVVYHKKYDTKKNFGMNAVTLDDWTLWIERIQKKKKGHGFNLPWRKPHRHIYNVTENTEEVYDYEHDVYDETALIQTEYLNEIGENKLDENEFPLSRFDALENTSAFDFPSTPDKPKSQLRIPGSVVKGIVYIAIIVFVTGVFSFLLYMRYLELCQEVLERRRLYLATIAAYGGIDFFVDED